jgi:flagellar basal body P-ring formation protein FlgA
MNAKFAKQLLIALLATGLLAAPVVAAPVLKADVSVTSDIVTIGDMFANAGDAAPQGIFRAPAPGTTGYVSLAQVRSAANAAGLDGFDSDGVTSVRVARLGELVDTKTLDDLIEADMHRRNLITDAQSADISFSTAIPALYAARQDQPVQLTQFAFAPSNGLFEAHFTLAGVDQPIVLTGRAEVMVKAPFLTRTLDQGTVITPEDIQMTFTPKRYAATGVLLSPDDIVGKVLRHRSRDGFLIRPNDLEDKRIVARNDTVTVFLRQGPLTLTVKGQALNDASMGEPVAVLNLASKKTIHGKAVGPGAVALETGAFNLAGL